MYQRSIFPSLLAHLAEKQVTVLTGMRRVGKSTSLKFLLDHVPHSNKQYFDLERVEFRSIFKRERLEDTEQELQLRGLDLSQPCVIALDEIQLLPEIVSTLKYFYDHRQVKFIVTGSSSFYLKNLFSESLAGRKKIFELYPLTFSEFLDFKQAKKTDLDPFLFKKFGESIAYYSTFKNLYLEYLNFGGFPEVVLAENYLQKDDLLFDILNSYIELDIKLLSDFSINDELYRLIRLLAARVGSRVDYVKLSSATGVNRAKLKNYFQLFEKTYLLYSVPPFTHNVDREITGQNKVYFADSGLLRILGVRDEGRLFENAILCQLQHHGKVNYYQKKNGQEIDFILNGQQAFEVKITPSIQDLKKVAALSKSINLESYNLAALKESSTGFTDFVWGGNIL
jgi:hypothetical protein